MESKNASQNNNKEENNNLFSNNNIQELTELKDKLKESLSNKEQQNSFLSQLRLKLYHILYENHSYKNNNELISDIIKAIEEFILSQNSLDILTPVIETLESLMMMFLFHFDLYIIKLGFSLVKFLIDNLEVTYCNELLEYFLKIIQLLNIKKRINNENTAFISSSIIYNISLGIYIILANNQILKENKKSFIDFIKKNISDVNLLYLIFLPYTNNQMKNDKIFANDEIKYIYEKIGDSLNTTHTDLSNNYQRKKNDTAYIKEKINKMGMLCRILNCVTFDGHRTYMIDKLIKNMIPLREKMLETFDELKNTEIKFPSETIENIFTYFITLGGLSLENLVKLISLLNRMFNDYSCGYFSIAEYLIQELYQIYTGIENKEDITIKKIAFLIAQIIEIALKKNKERNNNKINLDIYELYHINKAYQVLLKIAPNLSIQQNKFPNIYELFIENKDKNILEEIQKGYNEKNFKYLSQIYLNCISQGNDITNMINKQSFIDCFNKFIDFKKSIREPLSIKNENELDKNIEKQKKEMISKQNISQEEFKNFFLKSSMEMFNEICKLE